MSTSVEKVAPEECFGAFIHTLGRYFAVIGGVEAAIQEPSFERRSPVNLDFTGYSDVAGLCGGWLAISMPAPLLDDVLKELGETERSTELRKDLASEIVNTVVSNVRAVLGEHLRVSPPVATVGPVAREAAVRPPIYFKQPFSWRQHHGFMLIALNQE
jgi:hypothetical protein